MMTMNSTLTTEQLRQLITAGLPSVKALWDEPMAKHTSFRIGGPADALLVPGSYGELRGCLSFLHENGLPFFLLGGGTNLLVSDRGVRGVVVQTTALDRVVVDGARLVVQSGASVAKVCERALDHGLSGLEFLHGMPGTIGGAVWMNARCYGGSVSDVFVCGTVIVPPDRELVVGRDESQFGYKISPFQTIDGCIKEVVLGLKEGRREEIRVRMQQNYEDRVKKGHFRAPSAGSLFKNDRRFGAPSGQILDELNMRGRVSGGAEISSYHANIFINRDNASAADVLDLIIAAQQAARKARQICLEPEVRFVGEWLADELAPLNCRE